MPRAGIPDPPQPAEPPPMTAEEVRDGCARLKSSLCVDKEKRDYIEELSKDQTNSKHWHEARQHRLTASDFHKIKNIRKGTDPKTFLKQKLYTKSKIFTKTMKNGLEREGQAAERYRLQKAIDGDPVTLHNVGFHVSLEKGFLGATPDRIAVDRHGSNILVELKNPENSWDLDDMRNVMLKQPCLKSENGEIVLKTSHSYYTQVQGQMYVLNAQYCDFVICTKHTMWIKRIERNQHFINEMLLKLEDFFDNIFAPEIVNPKVKFSKPCVDLRVDRT